MALILHLETATPTCSVALSENGRLLALKEETASNIHAGAITLFIETVIREAGRELSALDAVCVSKGPGSYTGLRIGVSTAKGLCYALEKPLIAVNTLEAMASGMVRNSKPAPGTLLCPMLDARRMEVFMAVYRSLSGNEVREVNPPRAMIMEASSLDRWLTGTRLLLFGTGAEKCAPLFQNHPETEIIPDFRQSAANLIRPAEEKYSQQLLEDLAYFEPFYLKDFIGSTPKK